MSLPFLIASLAVMFFGVLAISSSIREDKLRKRLKELQAEQKSREFEEQLLAEIYDSIDHSPNIKKLADIITKHIVSILPCTTVSTLIAGENKLNFSITAVEPVSHEYIDNVKETMQQSLTLLEKRSFKDALITEEFKGTTVSEVQTGKIAASFNVPLMIHNSVAAVITVTSTEPDHFPDAAIRSLQRIIKHTGKTISKLDAALEVEKGKMTAMIESLSDGLFMIDTQNNLQFINPVAKQLLHLHKGNPDTLDVLSALPINHDFVGKLKAALQNEQTSEVAGIELKNKLVSFTVAPVRSSTGAILGASVIMHDETLKSSVPRMKEDFTNIIVHELRNPLTSIRASSELLTSTIHFSPEEQKKLIELIYRQADKLLTDVQQILDAAKLEADVFILHKKQDDINRIIKDIAAGFQKEAQQKMINYIIDADSRLPNFSFDAHYIGKALTNVLSNSFKFTSAGGTIRVAAKQKDGNAVISIADTGAGIPKDKQHQLFHKFSQIADASATVGKGLGLYLVKGVVEAHGGSVNLDSDRGRGTTITLTIPLTDATHHTTSHQSKTNDHQRMVN